MRIPKLRKHHRGGAFVEWQGKRVSLGAKYGTAKARRAYDKFLADNVYPILEGTPVAAVAGGTIQDLLFGYLTHAEAYYGRQSSQYGHFVALVKVVKPRHPKTPINEFGPVALKKCRDAMIALGWSRGYVNDQTNRLRRIFRWGVANEACRPETLAALLAVDSLRKGKTTAPDPEPVQPVAWAIVKATLPYLSPTVAAMVQVQHLSGARPGEICDMRPCDIDKSGAVWVYTPQVHKTQWRGKSKRILLGPRAQALLARYEPHEADGFYFRPLTSVREHNDVRRKRARSKPKPNQKLRHWRDQFDACSYRRAVAAAVKATEKAGVILPHWHPHQLRHASATSTREQFGVEGAAAQTGNTLAAAQIYAERDWALAWRIALETG